MATLTTQAALQFTYHLPYGATVCEGGVHFVVFSRSAQSMRVLLYDKVTDPEPKEILPFDRLEDRWGSVWCLFVPGIGPGQLYHFQADGPWNPERGLRFEGAARLIDPYARALAGEFLRSDDKIVRPPKCVVVDEHFDWHGDRHIKRNLSDTVIYELHVRGFTQGATDVEAPGTYLGVIEKIPYLKSLGVTAVELMPVHEFPTNDFWGRLTERRNYWGYDPLAFFAPHRGYACDGRPGAQVQEFKQMVRALHQAGIEVILDVVFNHTAEGNERGPTLSFKGLENRVYYMLENGGSSYRNYSGCGNTVNGNHPVMRELIFHCLRHWVLNYHIDGFRFDLASILSRGRNGELLPNTPIIEVIAEDPLLSDAKIIAEAWDAAGAYQVGSFANIRWAEWNGHFRDDVRRFWRGDGHTLGALATRLAGSSDLYQPGGRHPYHSINFITSHDGFTLNDLVTFSHKHNEANGEQNRDGDNNNYSANYGCEGPSTHPEIEALRQRQIRNMLSTLLFSLGVPMIVAGDECRRTQRGNNNAYCQDNEISWFDWKLVDENADLLRFVRSLLAFRNTQPTVRRARFLSGQAPMEGGLPDVSWYGPDGGSVDWHSHSLMCVLGAAPTAGGNGQVARHVLLCFHGGFDPRTFTVPQPLRRIHWRMFIDTAGTPPKDIFPQCDGPALPANGQFTLTDRAFRAYVSPPIAPRKPSVG